MVSVGADELAVICWYNEGDDIPPPPPPPPPAPFTVTFTKAVTTSGAAQAPAAGTEFDFDLDCIGTDQTFSLADGESHSVTLNGDARCSLDETNSQGADAVDGEFSDRLFTGTTTVTVTNHYEAPVVLGVAISKLLTTTDPAVAGDRVAFDISVTFSGSLLPNAEIVDVYENAYLELDGIYLGSMALDCTVFANTPDAAHDTVACAVGDLSGPTRFTARFTAIQATLPGRTLDEASVLSDPDGPGGDPPITTGPASDDVEIVEVLALPPLGDGPVAAEGGTGVAILAVVAAAVAAALGGGLLLRREEVDAA